MGAPTASLRPPVGSAPQLPHPRRGPAGSIDLWMVGRIPQRLWPLQDLLQTATADLPLGHLGQECAALPVADQRVNLTQQLLWKKNVDSLMGHEYLICRGTYYIPFPPVAWQGLKLLPIRDTPRRPCAVRFGFRRGWPGSGPPALASRTPPVFLLPQCPQIPHTMNQVQDVSDLAFDPINHAEIPNQEFADSSVVEFRDHAATLGEVLQGARGIPNLAHKRRRVPGRFPGNVVSSRFDVLPRRLRPNYTPSHFAILRSTS